jgi:hypothetical protein
MSSNGDASTSDLPTTAATSSSSSEGDPGTTSGTTLALDEGTTSTGPAEDSTTTEPPAEEGTTFVEIPCDGLGVSDCGELDYCLWYPEPGECADNPCFNPRHECLTLGFEECMGAPACAWVGDPELGECGPIECVPCEVLGLDQCVMTPTCTWNEMEMFCIPAD